MKSVKDQVGFRITHRIWWQFPGRVQDQVKVQVLVQVGNQVEDQVMWQIRGHLYEAS